MQKAIDEEVKLILDDEIKYKQFKAGNLRVRIAVSFDMGWNKRSSGNRYDSLSGHALMIGCLSKNIITSVVSSKMCRLCSPSEEDGVEPPAHVCSRYYIRSSKAMEVDVALHLYTEHSNHLISVCSSKQLLQIMIRQYEHCSSIELQTENEDYLQKCMSQSG